MTINFPEGPINHISAFFDRSKDLLLYFRLKKSPLGQIKKGRLARTNESSNNFGVRVN